MEGPHAYHKDALLTSPLEPLREEKRDCECADSGLACHPRGPWASPGSVSVFEGATVRLRRLHKYEEVEQIKCLRKRLRTIQEDEDLVEFQFSPNASEAVTAVFA